MAATELSCVGESWLFLQTRQPRSHSRSRASLRKSLRNIRWLWWKRWTQTSSSPSNVSQYASFTGTLTTRSLKIDFEISRLDSGGSSWSPGQVWGSSASVTPRVSAYQQWVGQQDGRWWGEGVWRKSQTSGSDLLFSVPWLHENEVSLHQSLPKQERRNESTSRENLLKNRWRWPWLPPWYLIVLLLSSVDQGADAATSLDKNENGDKQENREMWMQTAESTVQSTLGFATMGKAANLCLATRNAVTDLF